MENSVYPTNHDVLIIGAGPAGLVLGYYLQRLNVDYLILEQSDQVGASWRQMPDHLHLITQWRANFLIEEDAKKADLSKNHKALEFAEYLADFKREHNLKVKTEIKVTDVAKNNDGFSLTTTQGTWKSKFLVDCRGHFNYPFIPPYEMRGDLPLMLHFKDYKNRTQMNGLKNILIVGKRLSAGQLVTELAVANRHKLFLSARGKIHYSVSGFLLNFFLRHLFFFEKIGKFIDKKPKKPFEVPMTRTVKPIIDREVTLMNDISKIENKKVTFTDGQSIEADAILFATGFRPPKINLKDDFESSETEGLFYLGRDTQRTFTSRFIRGIREDAPILGNLIFGRLASSNKSQ